VKVFFDGGCRPGGMEYAVVVGGQAHVERDLGLGSAMEAEWLALIAATRLAVECGVSDAILLGDALAVISQANGKVRVPPLCRPYFEHWSALPRPARLRLRYVKRTQNLAGIALERLRQTIGN